MNTINRRQFVKSSAGTAAAFVVIGGTKALAANNKIVVGCMGLGGRGNALIEKISSRSDMEIAYLCDVDTRKFGRARAVVEENQKRKPQLIQDFRKMLADKEVDAIVSATPDHWHALSSIMACQAGKDVYVEKPMCHNIWEGRKMIEAARKYKRIVQVGMQSRSAAYLRDAAEHIKSGKLGTVNMVRVYNMMEHKPMKPAPEQAVPEGLDYEIWCGPAPKIGFSPTKSWLNMFDFSCGAIPGDAVHQLDLARYLMGDPAYPKTVAHTGGIMSLKDGRDTPDTQFAMYEYDNFIMQYEGALWTPYVKKTPSQIRDKDVKPDWQFNSTRIEIFGTKGFMYFGRHGDGWEAYDEGGQSLGFKPGRQADKEHFDNWAMAIRERKNSNADVEQGHYSALVCHMANISFRTGNQKLQLDPKTETFVNNPEANKFIKRTYRAPWAVPDQV